MHRETLTDRSSGFLGLGLQLTMAKNHIGLLVQVKEVIMAYFVLMSQGKATEQVSLNPSRPWSSVFVCNCYVRLYFPLLTLF